MDQAAEKAFREREQRLMDAVQLKTPDRMPIRGRSIYRMIWPQRATHHGVTPLPQNR